MRKPTPKTDVKPADGMTGVAFALEACKHNDFNNYRILYLFLVDGEIVHIERSQPYGSFEAFSIMDIRVTRGGWNLNSRFKDGLMGSLGGEDRDALVNRLKEYNPEILEKIKPALFIKEAAA